jgi:hypothetical protein
MQGRPAEIPEFLTSEFMVPVWNLFPRSWLQEPVLEEVLEGEVLLNTSAAGGPLSPVMN